MKKHYLSLILCLFTFPFYGCWVAHTAHDRPELRAHIGKTGALLAPSILFRDPGGRLHLQEKEILHGSTIVENLPAGTRFQIKDVVYRISESGREDYYVIEVYGSASSFTVEVPSSEPYRPKWIL